MQLRVVILSSHSLFAEGVASRLRENPQRLEVHFVDPQQPDYIEQIHTIQPAAILIAAADPISSPCSSLCKLLMSFFNVTIICLQAQNKEIQIIKSVQHDLNELKDLVAIVEGSHQELG